MQKFAFIFFLLFSSLLQAQISGPQKGWAATLTAGLIPISEPGLGIQPGAEYRFNERLSLLSEITIRACRKNSKDSFELNKQYFRVKSELRYSFFTRRKASHQYAGLQTSWARRQFTNLHGFYYDGPSSDSAYYYDKASVNSPVATVSLQFGTIITDGRFAVDVFMGIGARFIHTTLSDVEHPVRSVVLRGADGLHFTPSYSYAGNITMFQVNGGIRLMWHFYHFHHPRK